MKKILLIEDDQVVTTIYRDVLRTAGFRVDVAADGEAGLAKVKEFQPDLVQLDLALPGMHGVDVLKAIRAQPALAGLPIIVLSNSYDADLAAKAWEAGATECLSKGQSSPKAVLQKIRELLGTATSATAVIPPAPTPAAAPAASPAARPATAPAVATGSGFEVDGALLAELHMQFSRHAPLLQGELQRHLQGLRTAAPGPDQAARLTALAATVHGTVGLAGVVGRLRLLHLASALEALLRELSRKPQLLDGSAGHTVTGAVTQLVALLGEPLTLTDELPRSALILAVDDEPVSRLTIRSALAKAGLRVLTLDSPDLALKVLAENRFDLVFLDVNMPGMDGFELATKLHYLATNNTTPVVFVTALPEYESVFRTATSTGADLIAKPFPLIELAVKALTYIVRPKAAAPVTAPAASAAAVAAT